LEVQIQKWYIKRSQKNHVEVILGASELVEEIQIVLEIIDDLQIIRMSVFLDGRAKIAQGTHPFDPSPPEAAGTSRTRIERPNSTPVELYRMRAFSMTIELENGTVF
jgi:hypothetical protein